MRVKRISIEHFRSIDQVELSFPDGKPLVLFGPNNAGKSNIIAAMHRFLGEYYPPSIAMQDSDWFMRDKESYPSCYIGWKTTISTGECVMSERFQLRKDSESPVPMQIG